jgi:site-specific DNA-methyltransferase (adenine-specific)
MKNKNNTLKLNTDTLIHGDCLVELKKIPSNSIDLIFADPPYWMRVEGKLKRVEGTDYDGTDDEWDNQFDSLEDYEKFTRNWISECKRILKNDGSFWVIGSMQCIFTIGAIMQQLDMWIINDVIWHKKNPTPNFLGTRLNNSHETLIWAVKEKKSNYTFNYKTAKELNIDSVDITDFNLGSRKQLGSVWRIPIVQGNERLKDDTGNKLHSTQKPEELLRRIVAISSKLGDVVLDPFGGTMTTAFVAKKMGRKYITIESDEKYFKYGLKRLDEAEVRVGDVEKAVFDIKPPKASFKSMIEKKYFFVDEPLYYDEEIIGYLTYEGKIKIGDQSKDIHSAIAIIKGVKADRLNGWMFWSVERDGKLINIDLIRGKYLKEVLNYDRNSRNVD